MLALLLALTATLNTPLPELVDLEKKRAETVTPLRLKELRETQSPEHICPNGDAKTFIGLDRKQLRTLLGRPDSVTHPTKGFSSTGWHYRLSEGRAKDKPFSHHYAEYSFWFGPQGELRSITCISHVANLHAGWTYDLVHRSTYR